MIERCIESNAAVADDLALLRSVTPQRWLNVALTPIGACMVQGIVSDVTSRRNAELAAKRAAITDQLTGLANRQGFEEFWANEIAKAPDQHFALLLIDLEGFKQLNDALGFPAGDRVLIGFAARIFSCIKNTDWVARVGGDEFAVVLPNIDEPGKLDSICQRILRVLGERFSVCGQETCLGASIGATLYPDDGTSLPALLRNAELALNDARHRGGQIWSLFNQDMRHAIEHRHNLANDLRLAIQRQRTAPLLSAHRASGDPARGRRRGADPLATPDARPGAARQLHSACRADRPDQRDRPVVHGNRLPATGRLAGSRPRPQPDGQRLGPADS